MRRTTRHLLTIGALALLLGALAFGSVPGLVAQDASPAAGAARPVHVHTGTCDSLGEVVAPLTDLTSPTGTAVGNAAAIPVEYSFTGTVPLSLEAMLAADHAINAHESAENIGTYIACGEIGGVIDANGSLVIGLREQNGSGFGGIAFLTANATDPATTDVSVFITAGQSGGAAPSAQETPGAAANTVAVTLNEFTIDMPASVPAGPTTFEVTNAGTIEHSLEVEGQGIEEALEPHLQPGESGTLTVDLAPGTYEIYCPVGNHREQGMVLELTVTE